MLNLPHISRNNLHSQRGGNATAWNRLVDDLPDGLTPQCPSVIKYLLACKQKDPAPANHVESNLIYRSTFYVVFSEQVTKMFSVKCSSRIALRFIRSIPELI